MRTRPSGGRAFVLAFVLTLPLASCGSDDESVPPTTTIVAIAAPAPAATTTIPVPNDTSDLPVGTGDIALPIGTGDIPLPPLPTTLSVTIGIDSNPLRIERVTLGASVALSVTNPDADDEFHLHGYDLGDGRTMSAGQTATFTFVADKPGSFELESHETGAVLMVLEVV